MKYKPSTKKFALKFMSEEMFTWFQFMNGEIQLAEVAFKAYLEADADKKRNMIKFIGQTNFIKLAGCIEIETKIMVDGMGIPHTYTLLMVNNIGEKIEPCPALKMFYPKQDGYDSEEVCIEFVSRNCKTVEDALKFRNPNGYQGMPYKLT